METDGVASRALLVLRGDQNDVRNFQQGAPNLGNAGAGIAIIVGKQHKRFHAVFIQVIVDIVL